MPLCDLDPVTFQYPWGIVCHKCIWYFIFLSGCTFLQDDGKSCLPLTEIAVSHYPTTIIDLTARDVKQTEAYNEHVLHRFDTLKNELTCLEYGHFEELVVLDM